MSIITTAAVLDVLRSAPGMSMIREVPELDGVAALYSSVNHAPVEVWVNFNNFFETRVFLSVYLQQDEAKPTHETHRRIGEYVRVESECHLREMLPGFLLLASARASLQALLQDVGGGPSVTQLSGDCLEMHCDVHGLYVVVRTLQTDQCFCVDFPGYALPETNHRTRIEAVDRILDMVKNRLTDQAA